MVEATLAGALDVVLRAIRTCGPTKHIIAEVGRYERMFLKRLRDTRRLPAPEVVERVYANLVKIERACGNRAEHLAQLQAAYDDWRTCCSVTGVIDRLAAEHAAQRTPERKRRAPPDDGAPPVDPSTPCGDPSRAQDEAELQAEVALLESRIPSLQLGNFIAPEGGPGIVRRLERILHKANYTSDDPWSVHVAFELLHPYMDGNGRTGRAIWAWQMKGLGYDPFALPFLHRFYYQTLEASR